MRWFGPTWGAPVCDPEEKIPTPIGLPCFACERSIVDGDQGFAVPLVDGVPEAPIATWQPWHLDCFIDSVGVRLRVHVLHHGRAMCGLDGCPKDWPTGHIWVDATEADRATCPRCKAAVDGELRRIFRDGLKEG